MHILQNKIGSYRGHLRCMRRLTSKVSSNWSFKVGFNDKELIHVVDATAQYLAETSEDLCVIDTFSLRGLYPQMCELFLSGLSDAVCQLNETTASSIVLLLKHCHRLQSIILIGKILV